MMQHGLFTLIIKELITLLRDKKSRMIIIMPVLMQVLIFPFAATLELSNARIGVYDEDAGQHSMELIQRLASARSFSSVHAIYNDASAKEALDTQNILLLVRFPPEFSRDINTGKKAALQIIMDGRRSNATQIAMNYLRTIIAEYQEELLPTSSTPLRAESLLVFRNWYNPNLDYKWFILPSLIALITTVGVLILTALSVAREREQGTLDQLLVSPLATWQIFLGKAVPAQIIATVQGSVILLAGIFFYRIPFSGSLLLFYATMLLYGFSLIGIGLLISSLCATQQQAFIGVFLFTIPAILLSGYISPVENMPEWLQTMTLINPIRHFAEITKQIYLKAADLVSIWPSVSFLLLISVFSTAFAYGLFRRKVS